MEVFSPVAVGAGSSNVRPAGDCGVEIDERAEGGTPLLGAIEPR